MTDENKETSGDEKKKKLNLKGWWWKIPLAIVGLIIMLDGIASVPAGLPKCDSYRGVSDAKDAFNNGPASLNFNIKLLDIVDAEEVRFDEEKKVRICKGTAFTNGGDIKVAYSFKEMKNGQYWIEIQEVLR